ncbi:hypothetical protein ASC75_21035 [Aminobacter sp. DSM 101952]|nr:hypothetical protein ASC75_21035 [Aminobacter sp. DSM 101952]
MTRPMPSVEFAPSLPTVPGWARASQSVADPAEAAFCAGAALQALDQLVRSEPVWAGAWRQRLALKCAANACRQAGRSEDEAALRDAWLLRKGNDDPGPAGNLFAAWRLLAVHAPVIDGPRLSAVVEKLGLRWDDGLAGLPEAVDELVRNGPAAPFAVAAVMGRVTQAAPSAERLAWWLGDLTLAAKLRWPRPVPLLMSQFFSPALRSAEGRGQRIGPLDDGFGRALCLALGQAVVEACRQAADMSRRADRLQSVVPKLRAKGAGEVVRKLFDDDAVPGTLVTANLSRFAARRLFERLETFEAVRELSGRSSFRLYGL